MAVTWASLLLLLLFASLNADAFPNGYAWGCTSVSKHLPFCNANLTIDQRVFDLIARLSLLEKMDILGADTVYTEVDSCNMMDGGVARLGIPPYMNLVETNTAVASACYAPNQCATNFPGPTNLAASFNRTLWHAKGDVISTEMRALNNLNWYRGMQRPHALIGLTGFGPNINIVRDPRFGRNSELPSEDPFLSGSYAMHYVQGCQGDNPKYLKMISGLKHYDAYSVEDGRNYRMFNISTFDLFDTYLAQYKMGFHPDMGNAKATMCSYAGVNGVPSCANDFLLNKVIRGMWGRNDVVVSTDCGAIGNMVDGNHYAANASDAAAKALNGGTDLNLGDQYFSDPALGGNGALLSAIEQGLTDEGHVDQALRRALTARFQTGQFDPLDNQPYAHIGAEAINSTDAQALILEAALQGMVLLKNEGSTLPFQAGKRLAVIGPHVFSQRDLFEDYMGDEICHGSTFDCVRTIAEVFTTLHGANSITVEQGVQIDGQDASGIPAALSAVAAADQVVLCIGIGHNQEHEALDRQDTLLPGLQESFVTQVLAAAGDKPLVVVLINGGILSIDSIVAKIPALIEAFYPASRGAEALYMHIFGLANRWGKMPVTMYPADFTRKVSMYDFNMTAGPGRTYRYYSDEPLFPFGWGLSYATFSTQCGLSNSTTISCTVSADGIGGDEVLMVFHRVSDSLVRTVDHPVPLKALVDFQRFSLAANAQQQVTFHLDDSYLALTNSHGDRVVYAGDHYLDVSTNGVKIIASFTIPVSTYIVVEAAPRP